VRARLTTSSVPVERRNTSWGKWATAGAAVATAGAGGALLYFHHACHHDCSAVTSSWTPGLVGLGAGVALGAVATYLFVHDGRTPNVPQRQAVVMPSMNGAVLGVLGTF
jgi:hypothetical protein